MRFHKLILRCMALGLFATASFDVVAYNPGKLNVFTWDGYVTESDITAVNALLQKAGNPVRVEVIKPLASGPDQMFQVIRSGESDLSFLTLNYIKTDKEKIVPLLQPIDTSKLQNYKHVLPALQNIPMGMHNTSPLYVPFGGGAYGIWANMKKIKKDELPQTISDLLAPKWKGALSLTSGQVQPNIAFAMLSLGKPPFYLNDLFVQGKDSEAVEVAKPDSEYQKFLNTLYGQVGAFWADAPTFPDNLTLVASYGVEIAGLRAKGEDWQLVEFKEGNTVWLDTMNIMASVTGKKLEAAYTFIDYFLTNNVQDRVVKGLSMVAVTDTVDNPLLQNEPNFFKQSMFWPPYDLRGNKLMLQMSDTARQYANKLK